MPAPPPLPLSQVLTTSCRRPAAFASVASPKGPLLPAHAGTASVTTFTGFNDIMSASCGIRLGRIPKGAPAPCSCRHRLRYHSHRFQRHHVGVLRHSPRSHPQRGPCSLLMPAPPPLPLSQVSTTSCRRPA